MIFTQIIKNHKNTLTTTTTMKFWQKSTNILSVDYSLRLAWCLSSLSAFAFWSLSGRALYIFYHVLDSCFEKPLSPHSWCILRCWDDDFMLFYFMNLLRLFYDYDDLWLIWIFDGLASQNIVLGFEGVSQGT